MHMTKSKMNLASKRLVFVLAMLGATNALAATNNDSIAVSFFTDAQYRYSTNSNVSSFMLNDGAIYFSKKLDGGEGFVDIPYVEWLNSGSPLGNNGKTQAWLSYSYSNGLSWKLGKFDRIFGFEGNDTKDIFFASQGIVYGNLPISHTGLTASYKVMENLTVQGIVANHSDRMVVNREVPDYGVKLVVPYAGNTLSAGFLRHDNSVANEEYLVNIVDSYTTGAINLALEYDYKKSRTNVGHGFLLFGSYDWTETCSFGVRGEFTKNMVTYTAMKLSAGYVHKFSNELRAKLGYDFDTNKAFDGADSTNTHSGVLAGVYTF